MENKTYFVLFNKQFYILNNKLRLYKAILNVFYSIGLTFMFYIICCFVFSAN